MRCSCINPAALWGLAGMAGFPGHLRDQRLAACMLDYLCGDSWLQRSFGLEERC